MSDNLGLKVGIEIHQQLDTSEKLFCGCPTILRDDAPHFTVMRRLKPTTSELGEVDRAALFESEKGKFFHYQGYRDSTCLVELDEEPPHALNREAASVALTVALLLNMKPVDEIHVMRKIVIDGSNTTGFQRTAKIALDGWLEDDGSRISIQSLCLEEDAARKISETLDYVVYRLDRLGIPLVEISTGPDIHSGEQARRVALRIGRTLKATGRIKRGLGTIRQDLNISIEGGARVEIKGVQELGLIPAVVDYESMRQRRLLEIREELRRRGAPTPEPEIVDVTDIFSSTESKLVRKALQSGGKVMAVALVGFGGLLREEIQPGRRFGTELSDHAKVYGGLGGLFHTDELPAFGITEEELKSVRDGLGVGDGDCVVIVAGNEEACTSALNAVVRRAVVAFEGVPPEVRAANPDGTTHFMRPMPGSARMYPETDVPSIVVTREMLQEITSNLPELLEKKIERFTREFGLSLDLASLIVDSPYSATFEDLVKNRGLAPSFVAATFEYTFKMLKREGVDVDLLDREAAKEVLIRVHRGEFAKEAVPEILRWLANNKGKSVSDAASALSLSPVDIESARRSVSEVVSKNMEIVKREGERAVGRLMGDLMKIYRGKVDGKIIHALLSEEVRRALQRSQK